MARHRDVELQSTSYSSAQHLMPASDSNQTIRRRVAREERQTSDGELGEPDTGWDAWMMLISSSVIQLPIWGFSVVFGIFQEYYMTEDKTLKGRKDDVPIIGAACNGVLYLLSPFSFYFLTKYPQLRPYCGYVGLILAVIGYVASAFSNQVWQLILTQGFISAAGCGLLFSTSTLYLNEWFVNKKGFAYGVMWAGKSFVGGALPFAANASLQKFGSKTTMLAWTVVTVVSTFPLLRFIKPRIPVAPASQRQQSLSAGFWRLPSFWIFQVGNVCQGLGYFVPSQYLYSYATSALGFSAIVSTVMTASINASSIFGGIVLGSLCDRWPVASVIMMSSLGSAAAVFLFWGLSFPSTDSGPSAPGSYVVLAMFTIVYGFFAGGFSSTWSGVMNQLKREAPNLESGMMFGILAGGRGIGNVISGPISAALLNKGSMAMISARSGWVPGYESPYAGVIIFTGVTALAGTGNWLWQKGKVYLR